MLYVNQRDNSSTSDGAADQGGGRVRNVLFDVPLRPGSLTLVEMEDGTLRVLMNDAGVDGCHWSAGAIREAVDRFQAIKAAIMRGRSTGGEAGGLRN